MIAKESHTKIKMAWRVNRTIRIILHNISRECTGLINC